MQREIKFRAWNGRKMINDFCVLQSGNMFVGHTLSDGLDILAVMQYSGEKDINEQEIWEGDINSMGGVCKFIYGAFKWTYGHNKPTESLNLARRVIGNLYENPELINK